jgi:prepilin-type N-terminal cleavage/methylation domain-containing protein
MQYHYHKKSAGFTLVEIMIVVAIIALLAAIALPNFLRARKRSQASSVINDLRIIDAAMDQYSIDTGKTTGFNPAFSDIQNYLKTDTLLYSTGADILGDTYGPYTVDSITQVPTSAFNAYSDVADASFWGQYYSDQSGGSGSGGGSGANPQVVAADLSALNSAQANYNSINAIYQADMAANIGGQPRKDITAQETAAVQALAAAQQTYNTALSGTGGQ